MNIYQNILDLQSLSNLTTGLQLFQDSMEKKSATSAELQVEMILDHSGSMPVFYRNGAVQTMLELLQPFALHFNINHKMNLRTFSDKVQKHLPVTEQNLSSYVMEQIMRHEQFHPCVGRYFAPVMETVFQDHLASGSTVPRLVMIVTGGEGYDPQKYQQLISESAQYNLFWQFIGIGNLHHMWPKEPISSANGINNSNFLWLGDPTRVQPDRLYDLLLNKYLCWAKDATLKGVISPRCSSAA